LVDSELKKLFALEFMGVVAGIALRASTAFNVVTSFQYVAMLTLGFSLGRAIISFFAPQLAERKGSYVAAAGFFFLFVLSVAYMFMPRNLYWLLRIPHGAASGLSWPALQALVIGKSTPRNRAKVSASYFLVGMLATGFGYAISGFKVVRPIMVSAILFLIVSLGLFRLRTGVESWKKGVKGKKVLDISATSVFLSAFSLGLLMTILNTEITLAVLYNLVGRVFAAIVMALASTIGALLGYVLGHHLLDVRQSLVSLAMPGYFTSMSSLGIISNEPRIAAVSVALAQAGMTWWRSSNMALARTGKDTGMRLGLDNMGRNLGTTVSSLMLVLGGSIVDIILISSVLFTIALSGGGISSLVRRWRTHHI